MSLPTEITEKLAVAGYRPVTVRSANDLVGGGRYVAVSEARESGRFIAYQFVPVDFRSTFSTWTYIATSAYPYREGFATCNRTTSRSGIGGLYASVFSEPEEKRWYGHSPDCIGGAVIAPQTGTKFVSVGESGPVSFADFISIQGDVETPDYVRAAFDKRHPKSEIERLKADLDRSQQELRAQDSKIRQQQAFAQVAELRALMRACERVGEARSAKRYKDAADDMQRQVQGYLDAGKQVPAIPMPVIELADRISDAIYGGLASGGATSRRRKIEIAAPPSDRRSILFEEEG